MGGGRGEGGKVCKITWFPLSPTLSHQERGREKSVSVWKLGKAGSLKTPPDSLKSVYFWQEDPKGLKG